MSDERMPLDELLPPARQYAAEEWTARTWFGRATLIGEVPVVAVARTCSKVRRRSPPVYKSDTDRGETP